MKNEQIIKDTAEYNFNLGFQKGKLEEMRKEFAFLEDKFIMLNTPEFDNNDAGMVRDDIEERIKQLSKEIGGVEVKRLCSNCGEQEKFHSYNSFPCKRFKLKKEIGGDGE